MTCVAGQLDWLVSRLSGCLGGRRSAGWGHVLRARGLTGRPRPQPVLPDWTARRPAPPPAPPCLGRHQQLEPRADDLGRAGEQAGRRVRTAGGGGARRGYAGTCDGGDSRAAPCRGPPFQAAAQALAVHLAARQHNEQLHLRPHRRYALRLVLVHTRIGCGTSVPVLRRALPLCCAPGAAPAKLRPPPSRRSAAARRSYSTPRRPSPAPSGSACGRRKSGRVSEECQKSGAAGRCGGARMRAWARQHAPLRQEVVAHQYGMRRQTMDARLSRVTASSPAVRSRQHTNVRRHIREQRMRGGCGRLPCQAGGPTVAPRPTRHQSLRIKQKHNASRFTPHRAGGRPEPSG